MEKQKPKNQTAVSARQFAALRGRVKKLEDWMKAVESGVIVLNPGSEPEEPLSKTERNLQHGRFSRIRGLAKRHPFFWTAFCLMAGFVLGCMFCDFNTFGGY